MKFFITVICYDILILSFKNISTDWTLLTLVDILDFENNPLFYIVLRQKKHYFFEYLCQQNNNFFYIEYYFNLYNLYFINI